MSRPVTATPDGDGAPHGPRCRLTETDGNAPAVIGTVRRALRNAEQAERARESVARAWAAGSSDEVLRFCFECVDVR